MVSHHLPAALCSYKFYRYSTPDQFGNQIWSPRTNFRQLKMVRSDHFYLDFCLAFYTNPRNIYHKNAQSHESTRISSWGSRADGSVHTPSIPRGKVLHYWPRERESYGISALRTLDGYPPRITFLHINARYCNVSTLCCVVLTLFLFHRQTLIVVTFLMYVWAIQLVIVQSSDCVSCVMFKAY